MKLLLAIVQDQDASGVVDALTAREYRVTRINTHGGFLKRGNATLIIGCEDEQVESVVALLEEHAESRQDAEGGTPIGAGTVFVMPVSAHARA